MSGNGELDREFLDELLDGALPRAAGGAEHSASI